MSEIADAGSIPDEQRCKRTDGKRWRCRRPAMEGKRYCEKHMQGILRQKKPPVPDHLRVRRARRTTLPEQKENLNGGSSDVPVKRGKRRRQAASDDVADVPRKRGKTTKKEDSISDQSEIVKDLKFGRMEIERATPSSSQKKSVKRTAIKVGASSTNSGPRRAIRSKNVEPLPSATVKMLPSIKAAAKKNTKKCHWCKLSSYCVLVKCSTCKEQFFCKDCINKRFYCKTSIMRECPVCQGECSCDTCTRRKAKKVEAKEPVIYDLEEDVTICDPGNEMIVFNRGKKFDFSQHLRVIRELLPVMEKMNQEKIIELDIEAKIKGISHDALLVQVVRYPRKNECSFCKAAILDVHRSCPYCPYIICMHCSQEFRDGYLHSSLENLKTTKRVRTKKSRNISWRYRLDEKIRCPPKSLGGCGEGILNLTSFLPFGLTKDLEESAKQILCDYKLMKSYGLPESESESSLCLLCDKSDEMGSKKVGDMIGNKKKELYFSTKQVFREKNLDHFMKHWGNGQPLIIQDVIRSQPDLNWDFGYLLCEYLEKSVESRKKTEMGKSKNTTDWCQVEFGRRQIFSGGTTYENVWNEFLKFKLQFSLGFLQDHFPDHYNAVIESLPVQEYVNPFTGFLNLAANPGDETENCNLGSYVSISYGGLEKENPMDADLLSNLCCHAYDVVNVLVHATEHSIPERMLNEVKVLMNKYNSQNHLKSSRKIANRNKLEEMFASSSRLDDTFENDVDLMTLRLENTRNNEVVLESDESESDDEDFPEDVNRCGAQWDVFRREDVPKLLDYLRKYNDKLSRFYGSPKKVVHPLFDEVFYLNDDHKTRLKEEFGVDVWSFEQNVGEAFIIPAGCPYQIKKIKSCVNVVVKFISPESASECIKLSDEVRLLPVNHKAKGNMLQVKKMVINRMQKIIEEMRGVSQIEWSSKCCIEGYLSQTPF